MNQVKLDEKLNIRCPITQSIFLEPVLASDGFMYEKKAFNRWRANNSRSPMTNKFVDSKTYPCMFMKQLVDEYLEKNPDKKNDQYLEFWYGDYKDEIRRLIKNGKFEDLRKYKQFDIGHMMSNVTLDILLKKCQNNEVIKYIIDEAIDLEYPSKYKRRFIHYATRYSNSEIIRYLINKGVNLNHQTKIKKISPIMNAIMFQDLDIIKYMIEKGANLEMMDSSKWRPIHYACKYGNIELVKYMIELDINLNVRSNRGTKPIYIIFKYQDLDTIKYFLSLNLEFQFTKALKYLKYNKKIKGTSKEYLMLVYKTKINNKKLNNHRKEMDEKYNNYIKNLKEFVEFRSCYDKLKDVLNSKLMDKVESTMGRCIKAEMNLLELEIKKSYEEYTNIIKIFIELNNIIKKDKQRKIYLDENKNVPIYLSI